MTSRRSVRVVVVVRAQRWSSSNFDRQATSGTPLSCKQTADVSVVYQQIISPHHSIISWSLELWPWRHLTDGPLVYQLCRFSFSPPRLMMALVPVTRGLLPSRPVSSDERITVDFIGNDRECASSNEHAQVVGKATNIIPEMQGI